jgi:hypothetical protein
MSGGCRRLRTHQMMKKGREVWACEMSDLCVL